MRIEPRGELIGLIEKALDTEPDASKRAQLRSMLGGFEVSDDRLGFFLGEMDRRHLDWSPEAREAHAAFRAATHPGWSRDALQKAIAEVDTVDVQQSVAAPTPAQQIVFPEFPPFPEIPPFPLPEFKHEMALLRDAIVRLKPEPPKTDWILRALLIVIALLLGASVARGQDPVRSNLVLRGQDESTVQWARTGAGSLTLKMTGAGITCSLSGNVWTCDVPGAGAVGYQTIQNEGSGLTQRTILNLEGAGVDCADDTTKTTCTISGAAGNEFGDDVFRITDDGDPTKKIAFQASGIAGGATRTVSVPDAASVTVVSSAAVSNQFLTEVTSGGVTTRTQPAFSNLSGAATDAQVPDTITIDLAAAATALAANGANCSGNNFALGVDASGVGECAQPAFSNLSGAATDAQVPNTITIDLAAAATALASNPTDCASDRYATTIAANGDLTCAQVSLSAGVTGTLPEANIHADIARDSELAAYLPLTGGTLTGQLITDNLGVEFDESDTNPTCASGNFNIFADLSEGKLKKCIDGSVSDLDTTGGTPSFDTLTGGTNTTAAMIVGTGASLAVSGSGTIAATTAAALAANPADCAANQFATTIAASGALTCAALVDADIPNTITIDLATLATTATTANAGDSATAFFSAGTIEEARIHADLLRDTELAAFTSIFTNKTYDAEGTGNVLTTVHPPYIEAGGCQGATAYLLWDHQATGMPAAGCVGTNQVKGTADFDAASDEAMHRYLALPADFTGTVDVRVFWFAAATTGTARMGVRIDCFAAGEDVDGAVTNSTTFAATPNGTTNRLVVTSQTGITITGCAAGELARVNFFRDGDGTSGTDDMTGDARVLGIELKTRRAQ